MPLVAVAAEEAVEVVEAQPGRPQIERTCLARHPVWNVVHLAEPGRVVAVAFRTAPDGAGALGHQRVVAGKPVAISVMTPLATEWWFRPVISAARLGEQSAVVWNML